MVQKYFLKSASIELKKELLSKSTPQNTKMLYKVLTVSSAAILHASHFIELEICVFLVKLNIKNI